LIASRASVDDVYKSNSGDAGYQPLISFNEMKNKQKVVEDDSIDEEESVYK